MRDMSLPLPLLRVESAFSSYGARRVLQGLTLSLWAGERLLGLNGAGKSEANASIFSRADTVAEMYLPWAVPGGVGLTGLFVARFVARRTV